MKEWIVRLESEDRERLWQLARVDKASAYKIRHANVLPAVETCSPATIRRVLKKKRAEAVEKEDMVHTAKAKRRVRLRDGKRARGVYSAL